MPQCACVQQRVPHGSGAAQRQTSAKFHREVGSDLPSHRLSSVWYAARVTCWPRALTRSALKSNLNTTCDVVSLTEFEAASPLQARANTPVTLHVHGKGSRLYKLKVRLQSCAHADTIIAPIATASAAPRLTSRTSRTTDVAQASKRVSTLKACLSFALVRAASIAVRLRRTRRRSHRLLASCAP